MMARSYMTKTIDVANPDRRKTFVLAVVVLGMTLLAACREGDATQSSPQLRLENGRIVFPAGSQQLASFTTDSAKAAEPLDMSLTGRLVWDEGRTVRLYPAFGGRVIRIGVKTGDAVKQGQTLAVLASPDFGQAQADARRAQSDFALAEKSLKRVQELYAAGVAPRKDLSAAEADHARAEAELARATGKVKLYGDVGDSIDQNLALASPIAGVVVERNINPGQELRPDLQLANSPAMFVITDPSRLWVQLDATESQIGALRRGETVALRSTAWPGETFEAKVEAISDFIDPATRTIKIRGSLDNRQRKLKGEMFVTAALQTPSRASLQVPEKAVLAAGGKNYVFVEEAPGRYARAEIKLDGVHDGVAGVIDGLSLGQKVVVDGNLFLYRLYRQLASGASD
jgi:membrane fusion protein, heavy metal efflux system